MTGQKRLGLFKREPKILFTNSHYGPFYAGGPEQRSDAGTWYFDKPHKITIYGNSAGGNTYWIIKFRNSKTKEWETFYQGMYSTGDLIVSKEDPKYRNRYDGLSINISGANDGEWREHQGGMWWRIIWNFKVIGY